MAQRDAIRTDVDATLGRLLKLFSRVNTLVKGEAAFLRERRVAAVVADIPGMPLEAAARAAYDLASAGRRSAS